VGKAAKTKQSEQTTAKSKEMRDDRFFALPRSGRQFQRLIPFMIPLLVSGVGVVVVQDA
jgi:hypothetical protein